ncbi:MAG: TerC family protein [Ahniella sp.]|nr:TerC family protein [Ahniella sp.]
MELLLSPEALLALLTLATLEIVLGVDNLVFISIAVSRLPPEQRSSARKFGLALACLTRLGLLFTLSWLASLTAPILTVAELRLSVRDLVLIGGGLFLLVKGGMEIWTSIREDSTGEASGRAPSAFTLVIIQIAIIDIVFSLDSVITAVGLVNQVPIMATAIIAAVLVMMLAADMVGEFIDRHPTIKMLALAFIMLVGVALVADGVHFEIPRGYLYGAMLFSAIVEALNLTARAQQNKRAQRKLAEEAHLGQ